MPDVRLNKFMADAGHCARRKADALIAAGHVQVNGETVTEMGHKVNPDTDQVSVDGKPLTLAKKYYMAFHKPAGIVTSRRGGRNQKTLYHILPPAFQSLDPAGRLDLDSSGLLILSNDGDFINRITHPRYHQPKLYRIELDRSLERKDLATLKAGVRLLPENKLARMSEIRPLSSDNRRLQVTLITGYNRQIRRSLAALGYSVRTLERLAFGPIPLGDLPSGQLRPLTAAEIRQLLEPADALEPKAAKPKPKPSGAKSPATKTAQTASPPKSGKPVQKSGQPGRSKAAGAAPSKPEQRQKRAQNKDRKMKDRGQHQ